MVVANNKINASLFRIGYLVNSLDATVQHDNQFNTILCRIVYALTTHTVSLTFAVGNVVVDVGIELLQKLVDQCYRRTSVDIVVAVDHDALFAPHCIVQTVYRHVHVVHQERVYQLVQHRTEEALRCTLCLDAPLNEQTGQNRTRSNLLGQFVSRLLLLWCRWFVIPFKLHLYLFLFLSSLRHMVHFSP